MAPIFTELQLLRDIDLSFEAWEKRKYLLHFRDHGDKVCKNNEGMTWDIHTKVLAFGKKMKQHNYLIERNHAPDPKTYADELMDSKFCLVLGCDDAQVI